MSIPALTANCLEDIVVGKATVKDPIVQVIDTKLTRKGDQIKVALNDGTHYFSAVLVSQLKHFYDNGDLKRFTIIKLTKFVFNVSNRQSIIILGLEIVLKETPDIIGQPQSLKIEETSQDNSATSGSAARAVQPPQPIPQTTYVDPSNVPPPPPPNTYMPPPPPNTYMPPPPSVYTPPPPQTPTPNTYMPPPPSVYAPKQPPPPPPPTYPVKHYPQQILSAQNADAIAIRTIDTLNNFVLRWAIIARIVAITPPRTFRSRDKPGQLMSITLKDKTGSMIRGTFFNDDVTKWQPKLVLNKVYRVSGGKIKMANKDYNNTGCDYEITFDDTTTFDEQIDNGSISMLSYRFVKLSTIKDRRDNEIIDVIGWVTEADEPVQFTSQKGNQLMRKRLEICDQTNTKVELTIFGDIINKMPEGNNYVIAVKEAKIGSYKGKSLSCFSGIVECDPSFPEAAQIRQWWNASGQNAEFTQLTTGEGPSNAPFIYLAAIDEQNLGQSEKGDVFNCYVVLTDIISNKKFTYPACPNIDCRGKGLSAQEDGTFFCERCRRTQDPQWRWNFTIKVADFSGSAFATIIGNDSVGELIFGESVNEMYRRMEEMDESAIRLYIQPLLFKNLNLRMRAKIDTFNSENRVKLTVYGGFETDYAKASHFFVSEIDKQK
jgi:replication factor A1